MPFLRRLAVATGFVDRPGAHKSHHRPTPYLGGVGLIAGVLIGMLVARHLGVHVFVIALGAAVLGSVGLVDDHRTVHPGIRLLLQLIAASVPVVLGLRVSVTGVEVVDQALTLVWIVGVTNAFNLLDNMDGLSAGVAAAAGLSVLALSALGGQGSAAEASAAVVGACLGFLAYNRRPASIFMGDTGSLFLGFVVAVLAIEVDPNLDPPNSFIVPLLILGLPMLDTVTVSLARVRRGHSVLRGGRDHLSHRLVALGLSPGPAVAVLVGVELAMGGLAVAAGRGAIPVAVAVVAGAAVLLTLSMVAGRASVYTDGVLGWPRPLVAGAALLAGAAVVLMSASGGRLRGQPTLGSLSSAAGLARVSVAVAAVVVASTLLAITRLRRDALEWASKEPTLTE
ncbi:MAG: undecaprenyl/decaprenyl-phosphate alpha-N-acetylglucosaminyl 1-phosphate transferase [Actinomycetota bacterium]|nr:undecaprenyl/decaprenyl-phosphate alpha-N-acetylglucosaminyl 1-phosphate transferase [Actinomycetota bacterium]